MSSIYKLSISGIRSFSDETQETIQFSKPLTLIVGTNGSGKTTIIECLRYATTNELPPNTKNGASFINDPNLHSSNETKAQIKLAFQNTKKVNMILSKSLMAIKNPRTKQISFKTKENQLMAIHHGEKQTISSKVADIENLIPQHLGVSKAVLNYVTFCHQDESLWPISESAVLKKKFDEIFDSSKFIKILDSIKLITKEINADVRLINNNVEHLKNDKTRAQNKRHSIKILETQIKSNQMEMESLQSKIDDVTLKLQQLYTSNQDYERTISKMESLEQDRRNLQKNIEGIKLTTEIIHKPKEVLLSELNDFTNILAQQSNQCLSLQNAIETKNKSLFGLRNNLNQLSMKSGNLEALHEKHLVNLRRREDMIKEFSSHLDNVDPSEFDSKLDEKINSLTTEKQRKEQEYVVLLNEISADYDKSKFSFTKESQHLEYMKKDSQNLKNKIQELESRYESITGNQSKLNAYKNSLSLKEESFAKLKELNEISKLSQEIESEGKKLSLLEVELEENQHKMQITRKNNDLLSRLQVLQEMNANSEREMQLLYANITGVMLAAGEYPKSQLAEKYQEELKEIEKQLNRSRAELETKKFRKSKLKIGHDNNVSNVTSLTSETDQLEKKFNVLKTVYKDVYGDNLKLEEFDSTIANVENDYNEEFEDFKDIQFLLAFNTRAIKSAEKKHMCYLCRRKFDENDPHQQEQLPKFIELLQNRNNELSQKVGVEKSINMKESLLNTLRDFRTNATRLSDLQTKLIPNLKRDIDENGKLLKSYDDEIESAESDISEQKAKFNKLKEIEQDVATFERLSNSITEKNEQIKRLNDTLSEQGLSTNTEELEAINKDLYSKLKNIRNVIESLRLDRDMKQKRNNELENEINQVKLSINDLELKSLDKINIEKAIKETKDQLAELEQNMVLCRSKIDEFGANVKKFENDLARQRKIRDDDIQTMTTDIQQFENIKKNFTKIDEDMKEYRDNGVADRYEKCKVDITNLKSTIEMNQKSIDDEQKELKRLESFVSDSSHQERNIRSNINLLNFEEDLQSIEEQIGKLDTKQAQAQRTEYLKQTSLLQDTQKDYQKEYATKLGETTQLERQMKEAYAEINRDYKDVDKKYTCEYAKLQTKLAMATDLTTLYKATDNGVMEFHQTQMQKINNIIDELWKKTYTGNDVETIKIKADPIAVKKKSETSATNNRSYNYRIVMIKNGTELDMRGRCSAGQRVLASIIIRIALAECFCLNFGMIALDEPTTNLDDENIESLAKALHAIIQERSVQRNFQLIIITHDEKFLRCMNAVDFTDHYYKVMRDERLNSTINKVSIATVTE